MRYRYTGQRYECKAGHVSEFVVEDRDRMKTQRCKACGKKAQHVLIAQTVSALPKATIIYEKPVNGKVERLYIDPKEPESVAFAEKQGFARREIQGVSAIRQFEREVTREMQSEYAARMRGDHERRQEFYKQYHSDLRALMNRSDVHPWWREVFKTAIEETGHEPLREYEPNFHNAAYS